MIPYGRHSVDEADIEEVVRVLRSDWLTSGPVIDQFEEAMKTYCGASNAVAVSNGTAALHAAMYAAGVGKNDEVIVPPITFAATANAAVFLGGTPIFADVDQKTLLIDPKEVEKKITPRTKAVVAVDYAGQPCQYDELIQICEERGLTLISDACHSLGAEYKGRRVGSLSDFTILSFHPVKHITSGEGGMILTENKVDADRMRRFRNHGIDKTANQRNDERTWLYNMSELGYNYRITDFQSALALSQLRKLPAWLRRRREIARRYDDFIQSSDQVEMVEKRPDCNHSYHLYVIRIKPPLDRKLVFLRMRKAGIGVNVHYIPVHYHTYYRNTFGYGEGLCPIAEQAYREILTLPLYPTLIDEQQDEVIFALSSILRAMT